MTLTIRTVQESNLGGAALEAFLALPDEVYRGDGHQMVFTWR